MPRAARAASDSPNRPPQQQRLRRPPLTLRDAILLRLRPPDVLSGKDALTRQAAVPGGSLRSHARGVNPAGFVAAGDE
jgi:hypothetical protein